MFETKILLTAATVIVTAVKILNKRRIVAEMRERAALLEEN